MINYFLVTLLHTFSCLLKLTLRIRYAGYEFKDQAKNQSPLNSYTVAVWHETLFAGIISHKGEKFSPLISKSKDGDLVAYTCERFGYTPIRGSSSRGGKEAKEELLVHLKEGKCPAITIDGPRGPRRKAKSGIVDIAIKSGIPILPMYSTTDRYWTFSKSWDQFRLAKPFSRLINKYGPPIFIPKDTPYEDYKIYQLKVEESLSALEYEMEKDFKKFETLPKKR